MTDAVYISHFKVDPDTKEVYYFINGSFRKLVSASVDDFVSLMTNADGLLPFKLISGDFGGNFATFSYPPKPAIPTIIIARDTNTTNPASRLIVFDGTDWKYVDLS